MGTTSHQASVWIVLRTAKLANRAPTVQIVLEGTTRIQGHARDVQLRDAYFAMALTIVGTALRGSMLLEVVAWDVLIHVLVVILHHIAFHVFLGFTFLLLEYALIVPLLVHHACHLFPVSPVISDIT